jgi:formylglycine-generating enzyme required for sulfatase activity
MDTKPWLDREFAQDATENAVTYVSWDDCQEFIERLNACGERKYRLPTEAESDYVSRAGYDGKAMFWLANEHIDDYAWHLGNTIRASKEYAHPVGKKKANPWGLFDIAGNALEWCYDRFEYRYWRTGTTKTDPMGPEHGSSAREFHVVRGGSFYYSSRQIRTEYDRSNDIDPSKAHRRGYRNFDVGFRVVRLAQ